MSVHEANGCRDNGANGVHRAVAPAKINLFLKVTGRRADGYHELCSLVVPLAEPADRITLSLAKVTSVASGNSEVPDGKANICFQALKKYAAKAKISIHRKITIEKRIPVAAGLGGGSSDAATVLRLLNSEYGALCETELLDVARQCGADVPFFLQSKPAAISGIGEIVRPLEAVVPELPLVLVNPGFPVSAAWAYRHLIPSNIGSPDKEQLDVITRALTASDVASLGKLLHNDLAPALYRKFLLLRMIRDELLRAGTAGVDISGSGPTLFALCEDSIKRRKIAAAMRQRYPAAIIIETST